MKVIIAKERGFCFGVRDALEVAESHAAASTTTILGELVHNEGVNRRLAELGYATQAESDRTTVPDTPNVLITAHGVSDRARARLEAAGRRLVDTTCPLVQHAHDTAKHLQEEGRYVVIIGKRDHVEVQGLVGDLHTYDIIEDVGEVMELPAERIGVMCQTTCPAEEADEIVEALRRANPQADVVYEDTICRPTKARIAAVDELIPQVQGVVVVGGANSNNTRRLVERIRSAGRDAWHVQSREDIDPTWFTGLETIGLTAGTSTPDDVILGVRTTLESLELSPATA